MAPAKYLFFFLLLTGTLITITAPTWFVAWMGLEINLLSFVPLMKNSPSSSESSLKYFLMQAIASIIIILSLSTDLVKTNNLITAALILKLGAAPLHFWLPPTMKSLSPLNSATLLSWQKIAPLSLMPSAKTTLMFMPIIMSAFIGAWSGMNELRIKLLLAYASINHLAWLLMMSMYSMKVTYFYLLMYTTLVFTIFLLMGPVHHISQMWLSNYSPLIIFSLLILSTAGLPPLTGFIPKWIAMNMLIKYEIIMLVMLMMTTVFLIYFYLRLSWSSMSQAKLSSLTLPRLNMKPWILLVIINLTLPFLGLCL